MFVAVNTAVSSKNIVFITFDFKNFVYYKLFVTISYLYDLVEKLDTGDENGGVLQYIVIYKQYINELGIDRACLALEGLKTISKQGKNYD